MINLVYIAGFEQTRNELVDLIWHLQRNLKKYRNIL